VQQSKQPPYHHMHAVSSGTALYCTVLYYTALYYTVLYSTTLHYTALYYTVLYCALILTYNDFAHHTALGESFTGHGSSRHFHLHLAVIYSRGGGSKGVVKGGSRRWRGWRGLGNEDKAKERVGMLEARV
jgi:hypothetical protein